MGVKGLWPFLLKHCPRAIKPTKIGAIGGRKIAVDASMQIYQFLISIRHLGSTLVDEHGNTTSHLQGMFTRAASVIRAGVIPIYVFDGKAPDMKRGELDRRAEVREHAGKQLEEAIAAGAEDEVIEKLERRTIHMEGWQVEECRRLLALMGVQYVVAPGEAEAECAALARSGAVWAAATEDADVLAHGTPRVIRHLAGGKEDDLKVVDSELILLDLGLTRDQFIDFCILCGCDYCPKIKGIGPERAYELIRDCGSIEAVIGKLDPDKFVVPPGFDFEGARRLFAQHDAAAVPEVRPAIEEEELVNFLVHQKGFHEARVRGVIEGIKKARQGGRQSRMDQFFKMMPKTAAPPPPPKKTPEKKPPKRR